MRRTLLAAGALLPLLLPQGADGQAGAGDPTLRFLQSFGRAATAEPPAAAALRRGPAPPLAGGTVLPVTAALVPGPGEPRLRVLVRLPPGGEAALRALGGEVGARAGDIVTARVPLGRLAELAALPGAALEAAVLLTPDDWARDGLGAGVPSRESRRSLPAPVPLELPGTESRPHNAAPASVLLDRAGLEAGVERLRQRVGDAFHGLTGAGVIVGVYDSGLDLDHPDFLRRDAEGRVTSRVLYAWDQTAEAGTAGLRPPGAVGEHAFDYGVECRAHVEGELTACPLEDRTGHGTHAAGVAAGDGSATGNGQPAYRFVGMAPEAELIVVKGGDTGFTSDGVVDGLAYIFARAAELGLPAVVNVSLGTQSGPHDGTTLFEQALDALLGPGRLLATIAGNQGVNENEVPAFVRAPIHAMGDATPGTVTSHRLLVPDYEPRSGEVDDGAVLELWYDGTDSVALTVVTPGGDLLSVPTGDSATVVSPDGAVFVDNAVDGADTENGDRRAFVVLFDAPGGAAPAPGDWVLRVEGLGGTGAEYHLWLVGATFQSGAAATALRDGTSNTHVIASPGTAERALSAAAFTSRHAWASVEGGLREFPVREPLGDIAFFSSPGPRRDGVLRPDVAAPGKMVVAAATPGGSAWSELPWLVEADGAHVALLGTSMAAPHLAGTLALLLQLRPGLTPEEARPLIQGSARQDAFAAHPYTGAPDGLPNAQWGHGKLDAEAAARALGAPAGAVAVEVHAAAPNGAVRPPRGTRVPLLLLEADVSEHEPVALEGLSFRVRSDDPASEALLGLDWDGDGALGSDEPVLHRMLLGPAGAVGVDIVPEEVVLPPGLRSRLLLEVESGGGSPNGGGFEAVWLPGLSGEGVLSAEALAVAAPGAEVRSGRVPVTVLAEGEELNLSANPVRSSRLVVSWDRRPDRVAVYSLGGRRVRSLTPELEDGRVAWDLRDDGGRDVANGAYFLVVEHGSGRRVEKLFVLRP